MRTLHLFKKIILVFFLIGTQVLVSSCANTTPSASSSNSAPEGFGGHSGGHGGHGGGGH
ncbi:hypothetical protein OQJ26_11540 [Legionella sp. PATHC038]|uniref:hypothetical protein n=1 Tax=Legionella sheltonii TaxID=2992041 RepID=UPI0022446A54|nr:hypothetical protein [Legionella sp. PATHC038]MCW8399422.1 hypothetical protein [Legionella sp. PATHC038]